MTITPSDSLDLLIARGPPDAADFAKQIAGIPGAYYAGLDEAYKRRTQDAFQGGVPTTNPDDPNSPVDLNAIYKKLLVTGGTSTGLPVAAGLQQQANQQTITEAYRRAFPQPGDPSSTVAPAVNGSSIPPPTAATSASAPLGTVAGEPVVPSINALIPSGIGEQEANGLRIKLASRLGVTDAGAPLTPRQLQVGQQFVQAQSAAPPPTSAPAAGVSTSQSQFVQDPAAAARVRALENERARLQSLVGPIDAVDPKRAQGIRDRLAEIDKELQPTEAQRNARGDKRPGETDAEYAARSAGMKENAQKFAAIPAEVFDTARKGNEAAQTAKYRLNLIDHSISQLGPQGWMGTSAGRRADAAKAFNTAADLFLSKEDANKFRIDPTKIANVEDFNKQTQTLGFELAKTLGSREAMQIVQQATSSVPNVNQSPLGAKLVSGSLRQAAQRQEDFYKYMVKPENRGRLGAEIEFNQQNPPEMYSIRAIAASGLPVPIKDKTEFSYLPSGTHFVKDGKTWLKP